MEIESIMINIKKARYQKTFSFYLRFVGLCIAAGIGAGFFSLMTDKTFLWFTSFYEHYHYWVLLYIPVVFTLIVFLLKRYFPYAGGSGLPQGYALDVYEKLELYGTYSIWTMFGKILLTILSIGSGAALGREGPTIQICASIFGSMKNISLKRKKLLIRVGSGIGVATAFNAPLGGLVFAFEEYLRASNVKVNTLLLLGVAVAGYVGVTIYGDYSYMGVVPMHDLIYSGKTIILAIVAGVLCGLTGAVFTWVVVYVTVDKGQIFHIIRKKYLLSSTFLLGLVLAIAGILSQGYAFGNGEIEVREVLDQGSNLPWFYALAKGLSTVFSVAAGVPGGYFSTALAVGAGIMDTVHRFFPVLPVEQFYLLGMAGFLAAITTAPLTAIAMLISIVINSQHFILPIIITSLTASHVSSLFGDSVYHQQVLIYIDKLKYGKTR